MALSFRYLRIPCMVHILRKKQSNIVTFSKTNSELLSNCCKMSGDQPILDSAEGIKLSKVVRILEEFADTKAAEKWDNVGLLIEPTSSTMIHNIMLTNDLTEIVMEEAIEKKINLIISYHPPIFEALKKITRETWKERIVASCLENRIAVYSPHTSWDAVHGAVSDWLADAFSNYLYDTKEYETHPLIPNTDEDLRPNTGMGRLVYVKEISIKLCVDLIKTHTRLTNLQIAFGKNKTMDSLVSVIAVVPGSGGSILKDTNACLFVAGEMSHHEILEANHNATNSTVILTGHSNSERGFLKKMCHNLDKLLEGKANISVSGCDKDPLITV